MNDFAKQTQFSVKQVKYNIRFNKDLQKQNILEALKKQTQFMVSKLVLSEVEGVEPWLKKSVKIRVNSWTNFFTSLCLGVFVMISVFAKQTRSEAQIPTGELLGFFYPGTNYHLPTQGGDFVKKTQFPEY